MKHKPFFSTGHLRVQISCNKHNSIYCCNGICHFAFGRNAALVSPSSLCPLSSPLVLGKAACTALQETRSRNLPRWKTAHFVQEVGWKRHCYFSTRSASQVGSLYVAEQLQQHHERQGNKGKKESRENKQLGRDCWKQQYRWREKIVELQLARN